VTVVAVGIQPALTAFTLTPGVRAPPAVQPPVCGNGVRDPGEACDGVGGSCSTLGYNGGSFSCRADCTIDRTSCTGLLPGWSCTPGTRNDGICDCGCDAPDPDCGPSARASACQRSSCQNGTMPALDAPWTCSLDNCANVAPEGRCSGDMLQLCDASGVLQQVHCSRYASGSSASGNYSSGTCQARMGAPTCDVPSSQSCIVGVGATSAFFSCRGAGAACVFSGTAGGACEEGYSSCGSHQPTCLGSDKLQLDCNAGQPLVIDCFALAGACSNSKCVGLRQGAPCSAAMECRAGLTCTNGACQ